MTLDIGFLGYRFMGKAHANALSRLPMFFPDAPETNRSVLIGRDESALSEAAARLGFDRIETDWREALDEVDVFYNLGPNHIHAEPTIAALESNVHVMCEKPLAPEIETARRMQDAARESDAVAATGFNYRYLPALQLAKQLIDAGELGQIYRFKGRCLQDWLSDPEAAWNWRCDANTSGTGVLGDVGSHTIDLARWLVDDIESLSGSLTTQITERPDGDEMRPVTTDDEYSALVTFESGAEGVLEGSRIATGREADNSVEIYGSKGALKFTLRRLNELQVKGVNDRGYQQILVTDPEDPYLDAWWPSGHGLGWEHTFVHENYEFLTAINDGERYRPDFDDGVEVQRVVEAIRDSDRRGERVSLNE
ncbi:Gfo/Idh/MocA family protein (plasmid) [Haloferax prahovense]|uniref:Gfo/Idh/MocA family protein n=1 Tax=Haloferax prahovense TaxID=381852 RepID=UPI003C748A4E